MAAPVAGIHPPAATGRCSPCCARSWPPPVAAAPPWRRVRRRSRRSSRRRAAPGGRAPRPAAGWWAQAVPTARTALRVPDELRDLAVGAGLPVPDLRQVPLHQLPESLGQRQVPAGGRRPGAARRSTRRARAPPRPAASGHAARGGADSLRQGIQHPGRGPRCRRPRAPGPSASPPAAACPPGSQRWCRRHRAGLRPQRPARACFAAGPACQRRPGMRRSQRRCWGPGDMLESGDTVMTALPSASRLGSSSAGS